MRALIVSISIAAVALVANACGAGAPCNTNADCAGNAVCVIDSAGGKDGQTSPGPGSGSGTTTTPSDPPAPPPTTTDPTPPPQSPGTPAPPSPPPMNASADDSAGGAASFAGTCQAPESSGGEGGDSIITHKCVGTARSCHSRPGRVACNSHQGCYYSSYFSSCDGVATRCTYLVSKTACGNQMGCSWVKR